MNRYETNHLRLDFVCYLIVILFQTEDDTKTEVIEMDGWTIENQVGVPSNHADQGAPKQQTESDAGYEEGESESMQQEAHP